MNELNIEKSKCNFLKFMAIFIPIVIVVSYAYFIDKDKNHSEMYIKSENTADINLITDSNPYINSTDITCMQRDFSDNNIKKKSFKVKSGNNKHNLTYNLSLCELTLSSNLQVPEFKWQLIREDMIVSEGNFDTFSDSINLASELIIEANSTHEYELRVWLEENELNINNINKGIFSGKITLNLTS